MIRTVRIIKAIHAVLFVLGSALLVALLYEVISGSITALTWAAVFVFIVEGIILLSWGCRCPLTVYAENRGATSGQVTDIFLPKWLADRVFIIYGGLFAVALVILILRLIQTKPS
jgi:hypothetical protein